MLSGERSQRKTLGTSSRISDGLTMRIHAGGVACPSDGLSYRSEESLEVDFACTRSILCSDVHTCLCRLERRVECE